MTITKLSILDFFRLLLVLASTGHPVVTGRCTGIGYQNTLRWTAVDMRLQDIRARIMAANIDIGFLLQNRLQ
jgi:hypothetical protein